MALANERAHRLYLFMGFEPVKNTVDECKEKDINYSAPLYVTAEFINNDTQEIKSQTVIIGKSPMKTV